MTDTWYQGRLLITNSTAQWTEAQKAKAAADEARMVFRHFTPRDEGQSRERVAIFESAEDAALAVRLHNAALTVPEQASRVPKIGDRVLPLTSMLKVGTITEITQRITADGASQRFEVTWPYLDPKLQQQMVGSYSTKQHRFIPNLDGSWQVEPVTK